MANLATHTQQFALKWNNFHSNLSSGFHELFEAADMVDVTLAMDGKFLQAHKVVLSICSPYFKEMFKVNPCKHPIVILKGVGHTHMKDILEFMYLGEVSILREDLTSFLRTAELLQVKGLTGEDSSESSSKEDEKFDCDNDDEEDFSNMIQDMQYNQHYSSVNSHTGITSPFTPTAGSCNSSSPLQPQVPNMNIPPINNKRPKNAIVSHNKRNKIDSNGNQNIPSKSLPISLITKDDDNVSLKKNRQPMIQDNESEYTDMSNVKSERSSADEESSEKQTEPRNNPLVDSFVDQAKCDACGKAMRKSSLRRHMFDVHCPRQQLPCDLCHKRFKTANSLTTHLITIHRQFKSDREKYKTKKCRK